MDYIRAALLAGKSVVTANKKVIAHQGHALLTLAERQGASSVSRRRLAGPCRSCACSARHGRRSRAAFAAILNATSNAVLSRMEPSVRH